MCDKICHNGTCEISKNETAVSYNCQCSPGYEGENCEKGKLIYCPYCLFLSPYSFEMSHKAIKRLDIFCKFYLILIDLCDPNPCLNGGTCRSGKHLHVNSMNERCKCTEEYEGFFCDTSKIYKTFFLCWYEYVSLFVLKQCYLFSTFTDTFYLML